MAIQWSIYQRRFVDPYSPVDSDNVDLLGKAFSKDGKGRGITTGLEVALNDSTHIGISAGVIMKDYMVIEWLQAISLDIRETHAQPGSNYIVMWYRYEKKDPPNVAYMDVIPVNDYNETFYVILGTVTVDSSGTQFIEVTKEGREENTSSKPTEETSILELCDTPPWCLGAGFQGRNQTFLMYYDSETCMDFTKFDAGTFSVSNKIVCIIPGTIDAGTLQGHPAADFIWTNGQNGPISNISWNNKKLTNLGNPTDDLDAVNLKCLKNCIATEAQARCNADCGLQTQINSLCSSLGSAPSTFKDLNDTPASYGPNGYIVTSTGSGLTYTDPSTISGPAGAANFTELNDTPASYSGASGYIVTVNSGGTGLEFTPAGCFGGVCDFVGLTDTPGDYTGAACYLVRVNATGSGLEFIPSGCLGSVNSFTDLTDTPGAYANVNDIPVVNTTVDGLTFTDLQSLVQAAGINLDDLADVNTTGVVGGNVLCFDSTTNTWVPGSVSSGTPVGTFVDLTDTPADYTESACYIVRVNTIGNGLEFVDPATIGIGQSSVQVLDDLCDVTVGTPNNGDILIYCTSSNQWVTTSVSAVTCSITCFVELLDTPNDYTGFNDYLVKVNSSGTGLEFVDANSVGRSISELDELCDVTLKSGTTCLASEGNVLTYSNGQWIAGNISTSFIGLSDTPSAYSQGLVGTNSNNNALEFKTYQQIADCLNSIIALEQLCDVDVAAKADGYALVWDVNCGKWVAKKSDSQICICCTTTIPSSIPDGVVYFIV